MLAGLLIAFAGGPGVALLFDAATFAVSVALLLPLRPRVVERVVARRRTRSRRPTTSGPACATAGREVRSRSWVLAFLAGMAVYHAVVLPSVFVIGPVLAEDELAGARSWALITAGFGVGCVLGDLLFLRWRPRFALRVASLLLVGASCQAAFIGSGLGTWGIAALELLAGVCVTGAFTLWETSLQEHVPDRALSRVSSYDYLSSAGMIPLGNVLAGAAAADSVSFLEVNAGLMADWVTSGKCGHERAKAQLTYMYERIRLDAAREPAQPLYEAALAVVDRAEVPPK